MLKEFHETSIGGHASVESTYIWLVANICWPGMKIAVREFVTKFVVCQTVKYSTEASYGLLQLLEVLKWVWEDLAFDFIVRLPNLRGYTTILVVIDNISKYAHFEAFSSYYIATKSLIFFVTWWLSCMECLVRLCLTETLFLQVSFGEKYVNKWGFACKWAWPTTRRWMAKLKY